MTSATDKRTYNYNLPQELIAQTPIEPRDNSRLLVYHRKTKSIEHKIFKNIIDYLKPNDILVLNSSRVIPARLFGVKEETGAVIEILLQKRLNITDWSCVAKPFKRLQEGTKIKFNEELTCTVVSKKEYGECIISFKFEGVFEDILDRVGTMPLPHYIKEKLTDKERYQTVYSNEKGSSAAPTAGLHWTNELLEKVKQKGVKVLFVMLHVGLGTFRPVKEDDILKHKMHSEYFSVTKSVADEINKAKLNKQRIVAVGTTTVRVLESAVNENGQLCETSGNTDIFIYPPYEMKIVDCLITNFHLPESTLIMLVASMCSVEEILKVYNIAVQEKYRFFSFGDAMFIE